MEQKMEKKRFCRFCKEEMIYKLQNEVMCKVLKINDKYISKTVNFKQFGWNCSMKDDNCDIVFDKDDDDKNEILSKEAEEKLLYMFAYEKKQMDDISKNTIK